MWRNLATRFLDGSALVAGVLSGTSADGIDVAIARLGRTGVRGGKVAFLELRAFEIVPFAAELGARLRAALDRGESVGLRETALLSRDLGRAFGRAARDVAHRHGLVPDLVGSHGQTVFHHDGEEGARGASLQLGDGDFVAAEAGCPVVCDFRQADLAAGGEGAPLSALADDVLFAQVARPLTLLNLGGLANITWLGRDERGLAFDTGPANALLDGLARARLDRPFDEDGATAARGRVDAQLLAALLEHPFFARRPPKSTGRDTFGAAWLERDVLARATALSTEDLLATAVELVAATVAGALAAFVPERPRELLVCGGGARNRALIAALERRTKLQTALTTAHGVPADAREALVFAVLAAARVLDLGVTRTWATGAPDGLCLGKVCAPRVP